MFSVAVYSLTNSWYNIERIQALIVHRGRHCQHNPKLLHGNLLFISTLTNDFKLNNIVSIFLECILTYDFTLNNESNPAPTTPKG